MTLAYFIAGCLGCFACGVALGALLWYEPDIGVFGRNPSAPSGLKMPKPVRIPYPSKPGSYQPIMPDGWDEKNIKPPVNMRDAAHPPDVIK